MVMNKETFSNKISIEEIEKWEQNTTVILNGGTGTGKTFFICNKLANYIKEKNKHTFKISNRKKILYVCNRDKLRKDIIEEVKSLGNEDIIDVTTYQAIQSFIINNIELAEYDYYVFDETHYFTSDSSFNKHTDLSYKYAISRKNTVSIYMSATANELFTKLKNDNNKHNKYYEYVIEKDYSYVEKLYFLSGKDCMKNKILEVMKDSDDKIVYFCNSTEKAYNLYLSLSDKAHFYCSKNNAKFKDYSELDCIKKIDDTVSFDKQLLITTVALDNGINLKDRNIKHIFCDVFDTDKLIQCLGRKRIVDDNDTCKFYIKKFTKRDINGYKTSINNILKPAKMFRSDRDKFDIEYVAKRNFPSNIIYVEKSEGKESIIFNELQYSKYILDLINIARMEDVGYKKYILGKLGRSMKRLNIVDEEQIKIDNDKKELEEYLDSLIGNKLLKDEQTELINAIGLKDGRGRLQKSISLLNEYFETNKMGYIIIPKKSNGKRYWILENKCIV